MFRDNTNAENNTILSTHVVITSPWSHVDDKHFEKAILEFPEGISDRWEKISKKVVGKSALEVKQHFDLLVHDITAIEMGLVATPDYADSYLYLDMDSDFDDKRLPFKTTKGENDRKRGTQWTQEEHRLFLLGLLKYGKGDWRSISRNFVRSRTPTQVASHAQKYFLRHSSTKEKKRSSIHDIVVEDVEQNWTAPPPPQPAPQLALPLPPQQALPLPPQQALPMQQQQQALPVQQQQQALPVQQQQQALPVQQQQALSLQQQQQQLIPMQQVPPLQQQQASPLEQQLSNFYMANQIPADALRYQNYGFTT